jgi:hypothetical protein
MRTNNVLMAVATIALLAGTGGAYARQAGAKAAPKTMAPTEPTAMTFDTTPNDPARLREIFAKDRSARRVGHVKFNLAVGSTVPPSVRLVALPPTIIDIQPTWRGDEFFRVGHRIVIVDPQSKEIIGVLPV